MVFGAFGGLSSLLWLWRSPIPALKTLPRTEAESGGRKAG